MDWNWLPSTLQPCACRTFRSRRSKGSFPQPACPLLPFACHPTSPALNAIGPHDTVAIKQVISSTNTLVGCGIHGRGLRDMETAVTSGCRHFFHTKRIEIVCNCSRGLKAMILRRTRTLSGHKMCKEGFNFQIPPTTPYADPQLSRNVLGCHAEQPGPSFPWWSISSGVAVTQKHCVWCTRCTIVPK